MSVEEVLSTLSGADRWKPARRLAGDSPLVALFGVQCRRTAFEWTGLRVTLDRELRFFEVEPDVPLMLTRQLAHLKGVVVEVKQEAEIPEWLGGVLEGREARNYSKSRYSLALRAREERPFLVVDDPAWQASVAVAELGEVAG